MYSMIKRLSTYRFSVLHAFIVNVYQVVSHFDIIIDLEYKHGKVFVFWFDCNKHLSTCLLSIKLYRLFDSLLYSTHGIYYNYSYNLIFNLLIIF